MKIIKNLKNIFQKSLQVEKAKLKSKNIFNFLLAYFYLFMLYFIAPKIGKALWPEHIEDKALFMFKFQCIISMGCSFLCLFIYLPGYLGMKWYKKYEITPLLKKPWNKSDWNKKLVNTIFYYLFNKAFINPISIYILLNLFPLRTNFERQDLPNSWQLFITMLQIQITDDFLYMLAHRAFHQIPFLYRYHKTHHQWQATISIIAQYCHPLEQIFVNIIPASICLSLFRTHAFLFFFWGLYKFYSSAQAHSSYQFPWSPFKILPFQYGSSYHQFHHTKNVGNYAGNNYFIQMIFGTNTLFIESELKRINGESSQDNREQGKKID